MQYGVARPAADLLHEPKNRCSTRGMRRSSYKATTHLLYVLDQRERRKGRNYTWQNLCRMVWSSTEDPPLDKVQIDRTLGDVTVMSMGGRRPLNPPRPTAANEITVRMVADFYLNLELSPTLEVVLTMGYPTCNHRVQAAASFIGPASRSDQAVPAGSGSDYASRSLTGCQDALHGIVKPSHRL